MRKTIRDGGGFEEAAAYSRAVRIGSHVAVSGTAARNGGDTYAQTAEALSRALAAARELGADLLDDPQIEELYLGGSGIIASSSTSTSTPSGMNPETK